MKKMNDNKKFLPKTNVKKKFSFVGLIVLLIIISTIFGFLGGSVASFNFYRSLSRQLEKIGIEVPSKIIEKETVVEKKYIPQIDQEEAVIRVVEDVSPSVVNIIVTREMPVYDIYEDPFGFPEYRQKGTEEQEVGEGTGFIVSEDGLILTNKHVVSDKKADYIVLTNEANEYSAEVLARDPIQDLAVLKVKSGQPLKPIELGDSSKLKIGQTVVAIGNALGEFKNTVSVGVVSGLGRTITASSGTGVIETLRDLVQTDAAINRGNSGGPLLNLNGEVIGMNTAMAQAENIGFAIPVNRAKRAVEQVKEKGEIVYAFLGVRYALLNEKISQRNDLPVSQGAWIISGEEGESAIIPDSAAEKAGLQEGDIILEFNNKRITQDNPLSEIIINYSPGERAVLSVLRAGEEKIITAVLGERSSQTQ